MATTSKLNLAELAASIVKCFPSLNVLEQRLSLDLYRLLAEGQPVPRAALAKRVGVSVEIVNRVLDSWPGVFSDGQHRVVGYWGLTIPAAYRSPHTLRMNGRLLSAWCAWDTLFLPELVGHIAEVESASPGDAGVVRLTITPRHVERGRTCRESNVCTCAGRPGNAKERHNLFLSLRPFLSLAASGRELGRKASRNLHAFDRGGAHSGAPKERSAISRRFAVEEEHVD